MRNAGVIAVGEFVLIALALLSVGWAAWLLWNGSYFLFMLPLGLAILFAEGLDEGDGGGDDPCMGW